MAPCRVVSSVISKKIENIVCGLECTVLLLDGGEIVACGRNSDNRLAFGKDISKSMIYVSIFF